jgi:hypothetical protein
VFDQHSFGFLLVGHRYGIGQHVERLADFADVVLAHLASFDGLGQHRQLRRQRLPGQGAPPPDPRGQLHPAPQFGLGDPQPLPQPVAHPPLGRHLRIVLAVGRIEQF